MNQPAPNYTQCVRGHIVFAFALAFAIYVAWLLRSALLLFYVSALFAVVLTPVVRATSRLRVGRWHPLEGSAAIFFLLLLVAGALTAFGFLALPPVIRDIESLNIEVPARLPALLARLGKFPLPIVSTPRSHLLGSGPVSHAAAVLLQSLTDWAGALVQVAAGFVLTLYFILEGEGAYRWFLSFLPRSPATVSTKLCSARRCAWNGGSSARPASCSSWEPPVPSSISRSVCATPTASACSPACST